VIAERTKSELMARREGEEANFLPVNLAHDLVTRQAWSTKACRRDTR
jgi:hypothetical protein